MAWLEKTLLRWSEPREAARVGMKDAFRATWRTAATRRKIIAVYVCAYLVFVAWLALSRYAHHLPFTPNKTAFLLVFPAIFLILAPAVWLGMRWLFPAREILFKDSRVVVVRMSSQGPLRIPIKSIADFALSRAPEWRELTIQLRQGQNHLFYMPKSVEESSLRHYFAERKIPEVAVKQ